MSATAFQLRRRQDAAERIVARLDTAARRERFIEAAPLACTDAAAAALYDAIARYTDPGLLLALAQDIDSAKRRRSRRRRTETHK